jgi:hypothetical protein
MQEPAMKLSLLLLCGADLLGRFVGVKALMDKMCLRLLLRCRRSYGGSRNDDSGQHDELRGEELENAAKRHVAFVSSQQTLG